MTITIISITIIVRITNNISITSNMYGPRFVKVQNVIPGVI